MASNIPHPESTGNGVPCRYWSDAGAPTVVGAPVTIDSNKDGYPSSAIVLKQNYGSSATGDGYFNTTGFKRATVTTPIAYTDAQGNSGTYTIEKLTN